MVELKASPPTYCYSLWSRSQERKAFGIMMLVSVYLSPTLVRGPSLIGIQSSCPLCSFLYYALFIYFCCGGLKPRTVLGKCSPTDLYPPSPVLHVIYHCMFSYSITSVLFLCSRGQVPCHIPCRTQVAGQTRHPVDVVEWGSGYPAMSPELGDCLSPF